MVLRCFKSKGAWTEVVCKYSISCMKWSICTPGSCNFSLALGAGTGWLRREGRRQLPLCFLSCLHQPCFLGSSPISLSVFPCLPEDPEINSCLKPVCASRNFPKDCLMLQMCPFLHKIHLSSSQLGIREKADGVHSYRVRNIRLWEVLHLWRMFLNPFGILASLKKLNR